MAYAAIASRRSRVAYLCAALPSIVVSGAAWAGAGAVVAVGWSVAPLPGAVVALTVWVVLAAVAATSAGERFVMILLLRWRPMDPNPVLGFDMTARLSARTGLDLSACQFYRAPDPGMNAYATGIESIAITEELIAAHADRLFTAGEVVAVLTHELGHQTGRFTRWGPCIMWLQYTAVGARQVLRHLVQTHTNQLGRVWVRAAGVLVAVAVGVVILANLPGWAAGAVLLAALVLFAVLPWVSGAARHAEEFRADQYAAAHGAGADMVSFLAKFPDQPQSRWAAATSSHPSHEDRIGRLRQARSAIREP